MKKQILLILAGSLLLNITAQDISKVAKTPPLGWNSWDCFGMDVTEAQIKASADYMAQNMKSFGWEYIVLDMGWFFDEGMNTYNFKMKDPPQVIDEYGRVVPNPRKFPSSTGGNGLKPLADHVHGRGLKFGIHIVRGIPRQAVEKNTPIKGTSYRAKDIASDINLCPWYHGMKTVDMTRPGAQEYYNSMIGLLAEWGVDFIKADNVLNNPYHDREIEAMSKAIKNSGRPIVLSLSAGPTAVEKIDHLRLNANMWRISNDMWDDWSFILETFKLCREWQNHIQPGHWPDCDMLPLGRLRINGTDGLMANRVKVPLEKTVNEFSRFNTDEKYTLMTLWSVFRSPLMMGGNLMEMDDLTIQLLTNKDILAVNQNSTNNKELRATEHEIVWTADDPATGSKYIALFNINDNEKRKIKVTWNELGLTGEKTVRDMWSNKNIGNYSDGIEMIVNPHGCGFYRLRKK